MVQFILFILLLTVIIICFFYWLFEYLKEAIYFNLLMPEAERILLSKLDNGLQKCVVSIRIT